MELYNRLEDSAKARLDRGETWEQVEALAKRQESGGMEISSDFTSCISSIMKRLSKTTA